MSEQSDYSNHRTSNDWTGTGLHQTPSSLSIADSQLAQPDQLNDPKPTLQTLMAMQQQYSPLHIPSFSGSLSNLAAMPSLYPLLSSASSPSTSASNLKIRGASDCPGVCPLCGATLRQARNLRRHLLSSCKYRLNNFATPHPTDQLLVEIKPEIDIGGLSGQIHGTDSRESNSCEQIICNPSPVPSPTNSTNVVSPRHNGSPTIAR